jgi:hypothetical protein
MVTAGVQLNFLETTTQGTLIIQACGSKETLEICTRLVTNECTALSRGIREITSVQAVWKSGGKQRSYAGVFTTMSARRTTRNN